MVASSMAAAGAAAATACAAPPASVAYPAKEQVEFAKLPAVNDTAALKVAAGI